MKMNGITLDEANKIVKHYMNALDQSKNSLSKLPALISPYHISVILVSIKLLIAKAVVDEKYSNSKLLDYVKQMSADIARYSTALMLRDIENGEYNPSINYMDYLSEDESFESFFEYCIEVTSQNKFWELIYSRL
jgi:hypothetical protein